jgi:hypothetical protein
LGRRLIAYSRSDVLRRVWPERACTGFLGAPEIGAAPDFRTRLIMQDCFHSGTCDDVGHTHGLNVALCAFHISDIQVAPRQWLVGAAVNNLVAEQQHGAPPVFNPG